MTIVFLISIFASLGAGAVAWGLYLESFKEKPKFRDVEDFRSSARKSHCGQKWVFWGVIAEMVLGFGISIWEGNELLKVNLKNEELRKAAETTRNKTTILFSLEYKTLSSGFDFSSALKDKPKMKVLILYPPNDENSWVMAHGIEFGFQCAGWLTDIIDVRPYTEADAIIGVRPALSGFPHWTDKYLPLSIREGTGNGKIALIVKEHEVESFEDKNSVIGALGISINSNPALVALPSEFPDSRLATNELKIVVGPGF